MKLKREHREEVTLIRKEHDEELFKIRGEQALPVQYHVEKIQQLEAEIQVGQFKHFFEWSKVFALFLFQLNIK